MYLDYFGLKQKPFLITPDPAFLYPSVGHQQALAHLQYGLKREGGFLLLTGEVGTGKTTLCRLFMDNLPADFRLAYLLNTKLESAGLLSGICRELGIALDDDRNLNTLVEKIYDNLLAAHANHQHTLVVIEEAQNLSPDVLETLRLLTNLETSATKLLHILLIGQPELLDTLRLPGLRQLNQRVVSRSHLGALSRDELPPYFRHRLKMAGTDRPLFSAGAIRLIQRKTGGIPRLVNLLAEHCLMGAYALGKSQVDGRIVREAARELFATLRSPVQRRNWPWAVVLGALAVAVSLLLLPAPALESWRQPMAPTVTPPVEEIPSDNSASESTPVPEAAEPPATTDQQQIAPAESPAPEPTPAPSAFQQLLAYWGIDAEVKSEKEFCAVAEAQGLFCIRQPIASVEALQEINSPMLIRLFNDQDGLDIYYLRDVSDGEAILGNSEQQLRKPLAELLAAMDGAALLLWHPPAGYLEPLKPGATNPELVAGLIRWLTAGGYLDEAPVTGGLYNQYLVDKVKAFQADQGLDVDGILGIQTLVELSRHEPDAGLQAGEGD